VHVCFDFVLCLLQYLAKEDPKVLAVLGSGHQGESHIYALTTLYTFDEVSLPYKCV